MVKHPVSSIQESSVMIQKTDAPPSSSCLWSSYSSSSLVLDKVPIHEDEHEDERIK